MTGPDRSKRGTKWSALEDAQLIDAYRAGHSMGQCASLIGRTVSAVENRTHDLLASGHLQRRKGHNQSTVFPTIRSVAQYQAPDGSFVTALAPEASQDEPEPVFLQRMLASANRSIDKAEAQRHVTLKLMADRPVAISLSSDWHVAATGTDLASLIAYADYVAHTPHLYAIGVGDLHDNAIKHKGGSTQGIMDELRLLDLLVGRFKGKLLGTTSGNHDDWSKIFSGVDNLKLLAKRHGIHYAPDELLWRVEIIHPVSRAVTATYRIHTRHQWRRGSALNPGHACWTWWQEEGPNWAEHPDVLAIGHNHVSVVESRQFAERDVWALRMGTFQIDSAFARAKGFGRYRATCPTVVLPPTRDQRVMCFADPHDAVTYMRGAI